MLPGVVCCLPVKFSAFRGFFKTLFGQNIKNLSKGAKTLQEDSKQHQVIFHSFFIQELYFLKFIYFFIGILSSIFHTNSYITLGLPVGQVACCRHYGRDGVRMHQQGNIQFPGAGLWLKNVCASFCFCQRGEVKNERHCPVHIMKWMMFTREMVIMDK